MSDTFAICDDWGPEKVIHMNDPSTGLRAILVIDNVAAGPAIGGCRMAPDVSLDECFRLARAMTLKNAAAALPHGGAKSVIFANSKMPLEEKERLVRSFAHAIKHIEDYIVGPDMGTDELCMAWCHDVIGRCVGMPRAIGGIPLDDIGATGFGLAEAVEVAAEFIDLDLKNATFAVQGYGSVGIHTARFLAEKGATLVGAVDIHGGKIDPNGMSTDELFKIKGQGGRVLDYAGGKAIDRDAIIDVECDIWVPAARPDVITMDNVDRLNTKIVAQGANIPASAEAEAALDAKGTVVLPDFIVNAGGVICGAVEYQGSGEYQALTTIADKITYNTRHILEAAKSERISPRQAALNFAQDRVRKAMGYRKSH